MKRSFTAAVLAAIVAALSPSLSAQWPLYPAPGVPKGPDGKPNLTAPAPRTADGKPDLSGIWMSRGGVERNGPPAGRPPLASFGNAGTDSGTICRSSHGRRSSRRSAPRRSAKTTLTGCASRKARCSCTWIRSRSKWCRRPEQIFIIYETNYGLRTIFTDGRPLPPQGVPQPYWYGYSVGRWEGDTLVVESNNFRGDGWLDARGSPMTEAAKVTERFRRVNYGQLDIEFTLDDPKAYTKPFTVRVDQRIMADGSELIEFICNENQQFLKRIKVE